MNISPELKDILDKIISMGGHPYLVGGCVRDYVLGLECHDYDIEVYHMNEECLCEALGCFGFVSQVGKSFAVYKIAHLNDYDFALPRTERKTGHTHKEFSIEIDPDMTLLQAIQRRDLTMNALMYDYQNDKIIDLCDGINDIQNKIIRCVNKETFIEDPLRVLRIAQFISRFDMTCEKETKRLCQDMVKQGMLDYLSIERIYEEYCKILMSLKPSLGFEFLKDIQALPSYINDLIHTHQRKDYHSEGNVFNHTMLVLDVGALIKHKTSNPLGFMWACLLHDIGKAKVTTPDLKSPYHASVGAKMFNEINMIKSHSLRQYIRILIEYHMTLMNIARHKKGRYAYYKVLKGIDGIVPLYDLYYISCADKLGRGSVYIDEYNESLAYIDQLIKDYGTQALTPVVGGKDLIELGFEEKNKYKEMLDMAYDLQLLGHNKEEIYRRLKKEYDKR